MYRFGVHDNDARVLADVRELLYIIAMATAKGPNTLSGAALDDFVKGRMRQDS